METSYVPVAISFEIFFWKPHLDHGAIFCLAVFLPPFFLFFPTTRWEGAAAWFSEVYQ